MQKEEKQELLTHPFAEGTLENDYVLTPDDVKLLEAMQQRGK